MVVWLFIGAFPQKTLCESAFGYSHCGIICESQKSERSMQSKERKTHARFNWTDLESPTINRSIEALEVAMIEIFRQHNWGEHGFVHDSSCSAMGLPCNNSSILWCWQYQMKLWGEQFLVHSFIVIHRIHNLHMRIISVSVIDDGPLCFLFLGALCRHWWHLLVGTSI